MDIPRITPCMPGAELTQVVDAQNYKGKISVRLGPVALAFAGNVQLFDINQEQRTARVKAQGSDAKGRGSANATAAFRIEPAGGGSRVFIHTDLMLSGAVAQYGRGVGMIQATAAQIIGQFAGNLRAQLAQQPAAPVAAPRAPSSEAAQSAPQAAPSQQPGAPQAAPSPQSGAPQRRQPPQPPQPETPAAKPIAGLSLIARVLWQQIVAFLTGRQT
jgi:carbon monoxide dehydrogenase subunit G